MSSARFWVMIFIMGAWRGGAGDLALGHEPKYWLFLDPIDDSDDSLS